MDLEKELLRDEIIQLKRQVAAAEREWELIVLQNWRIVTWLKENDIEIPTYDELLHRYTIPPGVGLRSEE